MTTEIEKINIFCEDKSNMSFNLLNDNTKKFFYFCVKSFHVEKSDIGKAVISYFKKISTNKVVNVKVGYIRPKYNDLKEWTGDPDNVYIARRGVVFINENGTKKRYPEQDSIWSNPFKIDKDGTREEVIVKYRDYIVNKIQTKNLIGELLKLKNKNLGCWCKPESCHGDVLVDLINTYSV